MKKKLTIPRPHQHEEHKLEETTARNQTLQDLGFRMFQDHLYLEGGVIVLLGYPLIAPFPLATIPWGHMGIDSTYV